MSNEDVEKMSSEDIFYEFCIAKPKKAGEFFKDYILYLLEVKNNFEEEKYKKLQSFLFDFMVGADKILSFNLKYLQENKENFSKEKYAEKLGRFLEKNDSVLMDFCFGVFISNLNSFSMLKSKETNDFYSNELKNYKINIQTDLGNSSINYTVNEYKVLLKLNNNKRQYKNTFDYDNLYEISEKDLDSLINKLNDIYALIKD